MPLHDYRCDTCGSVEEFYSPITESPPRTRICACGADMRRTWVPPAVPKPWVPHFNHSVGAFVRSEREFRDHLRRGAEEQSAALGGIAVDYQPVPIAEVQHSEEGLEATRRRRRDAGLDGPRRTYH